MKGGREKYIDAHVHLQDHRFDETRSAVLQRALEDGVGKMVCNAVSEADWQMVLQLTQKYESVVGCFGVHPWYASGVQNGWLQRLESFVESGGGIGEIGLDGTIKCGALIQEEVFCTQLDLACRLKKPAVIHCVKRWGRMLEIVQDFDFAASRLVFHSFGGSKETLFRLLDLGAYVSFSSRLSHPSRKIMRQTFLEVPMERLFLETDAPDQFTSCILQEDTFSFNKEKDKLNEPAYVARLYDFAANLRKIDPEVFRDQIWENGQIFTN